VGVTAFPAAEGNGNDLPALSIVAEAVRVRHADEFVFNQRLVAVDVEGPGHYRAKLHRIRAVGNDQVFAVDETVWSRRV
jgi:hypothetical protein